LESSNSYIDQDSQRNELETLRSQLEETALQLEEANDVINAIRSGEIDALVVKGQQGHQLYTLKSADQTYRIFIEQMTEGAVTLNFEGNIIYCNSQFSSLVKFPLEKTIGQSFNKFIHPSFRNDCKELITNGWNGKTRGELSLVTTDGDEIAVLLSLKTLDLDEGLSMSIIVTDLTGQKQAQRLLQLKNVQLEEAQRQTQHANANLENTVKERTRELEINIEQKTIVEEELRRNQEQLSRILETMAEGVILVNAEGLLTYINPMAQRILGLRESQLEQRTYYSPEWKYLRLDRSLMPKTEHPLLVTMNTGEPVYDYEIAIEQPGKPLFYISVNAAPIRNNRSEIIGGVATFMDVTNRRRDIQQKDEFISIASHELKTPITSLKASLQLLSRMKDNPSHKMFPVLIDQSNKSLDKVSVLIGDLLNSSKITEGHLQLNKKEFVISKLVNDCCSYIRNEGTHSIITEGDLDLTVTADPDRIEQVIVNFVDNAIKYSPDSKEIYIEIQKIDGYARVSVSDKGPGIPSEKLPHLFDRYYRVDTSGAQYSGLGLGLYISSEIVKKHGGYIGVESEQGEGSTFWFTLPL
jgi:two-component system phosphate regulon sensor histidine kinase PhoR